jgi:hypothetical protein
MLNKELVSRVSSLLKGNSKDGRISRRLILATAEIKAKFLISQKLNDMSLYREQNLYTTISCIELEDIDVIKCPLVEFRTCNKVKRSKLKLSELIHSRFGHSLKEVTSLDGQFSFENITLSQYRRNKNRTLQKTRGYFYIHDNYLYIPDSEVKVVNINVLTQDLYDLEQCSECGDKCKSAWDFEFICPDKLLEVVIQETTKELSLTKQIQEDGNPNLNPNG